MTHGWPACPPRAFSPSTDGTGDGRPGVGKLLRAASLDEQVAPAGDGSFFGCDILRRRQRRKAGRRDFSFNSFGWSRMGSLDDIHAHHHNILFHSVDPSSNLGFFLYATKVVAPTSTQSCFLQPSDLCWKFVDVSNNST